MCRRPPCFRRVRGPEECGGPARGKVHRPQGGTLHGWQPDGSHTQSGLVPPPMEENSKFLRQMWKSFRYVVKVTYHLRQVEMLRRKRKMIYDLPITLYLTWVFFTSTALFLGSLGRYKFWRKVKLLSLQYGSFLFRIYTYKFCLKTLFSVFS